MERTPGQPLRVHLFGGFRLEVAGKELPVKRWKSKKALALLKYLVAKQGEKVRKDRLVELLWPDEEAGPELEHRLHVAVYHLRLTLEPSRGRYDESTYIGHSDGLYWFAGEQGAWVDADQFERLCAAGKAAEATSPEEALRLYQEAHPLYRGEFLAEDLYDDWTTSLREHYRELYVDLSLRTAGLLATLHKDHTGAVRLLRAALSDDPYREELHIAAMHHLMDAGRYAEVAIFYRDYTKLLYREFGLSPGPELRALYNQLKLSAPVDESAVAVEKPRSEETQGAFICDRATFDSIYRLELRRLARTREPLAMLTLTIASEVPPSDRATILSTISRTLRLGDVLCPLDDRRFQVQLPRTTNTRVAVVRRRLASALAKAGWQVDIAVEVHHLDEEGAEG